MDGCGTIGVAGVVAAAFEDVLLERSSLLAFVLECCLKSDLNGLLLSGRDGDGGGRDATGEPLLSFVDRFDGERDLRAIESAWSILY